jgi:hypothetical protein
MFFDICGPHRNHNLANIFVSRAPIGIDVNVELIAATPIAPRIGIGDERRFRNSYVT